MTVHTWKYVLLVGWYGYIESNSRSRLDLQLLALSTEHPPTFIAGPLRAAEA